MDEEFRETGSNNDKPRPGGQCASEETVASIEEVFVVTATDSNKQITSFLFYFSQILSIKCSYKITSILNCTMIFF